MGDEPRKPWTASLHDGAYKAFVEILVQKRDKAGLSQQEVADRLGWNQSLVAKIETQQRRMDVAEFLRFANAVGFDPAGGLLQVQSAIRSGQIN